MSHVVVTGACGFIGSHLVDRLLTDGHKVVGVDCLTDYYSPRLKYANVADAMRSRDFTLLEQDLLHLPHTAHDVREAIRDASCVYHLAAQPGVRASWGSEFATYVDHNVLVTQLLLEECVAASVEHVVYASSSSVYGDALTLPLREDAECRPVSPYGVTKLAGEHLCRLYAKVHGLHAVALRFFTVYGPRQRPDMAFHRFMRAMRDGQSIELYGSGDQTRDFTFVNDIVSGILAGHEAPPGAVVNLGGGHRITLTEALSTLCSVTGQRVDVVTRPTQAGDARDTLADLSRARNLLGYSPSTTLEAGLLAEWAWLTRLDEALRD